MYNFEYEKWRTSPRGPTPIMLILVVKRIIGGT
jgi:hypothetical protein